MEVVSNYRGIKLETCPFCGSDWGPLVMATDLLGAVHRVVCRPAQGGCGAQGSPWRTRIEAVRAWNKREKGFDPRGSGC